MFEMLFCLRFVTMLKQHLTPQSNVKRMHKYTGVAGKMSAKIIGVNTGKENRLLQENG